LRRAVPSFTVEVRRRPRLTTNSSQIVQPSETKIPQAGVEQESHRVAAAALEAEKSNRFPVDVAASYPKGRILQSLVPEEPLRRQLRDASLSASTSDQTSRAQKRPSVRALKGKDQTSKLPRNLESSSDQTAALVDSLSAASRRSSGVPLDEGTGLSPSAPTPAPSQVVGNAGGLALRPKAKRRDKVPTSFDDSRATPSLKDQRSRTGPDSLPMALPSVDESSRQSRKRTIMGRYVFGDELKPGERWKWRLLIAR
jgi:hypothetical protein